MKRHTIDLKMSEIFERTDMIHMILKSCLN